MLRRKQVNLTQLAVGFASDTDVKPRYRRLQRFIAGMYSDYDAIARLQMQLFDFRRQKCHLTLDRTNWQPGVSNQTTYSTTDYGSFTILTNN